MSVNIRNYHFWKTHIRKISILFRRVFFFFFQFFSEYLVNPIVFLTFIFSSLVKKLLENLKTVNNQNQIVFREVRRITLVSTLNVQTLDPFIISKMNNISNELKVGSWHCVKKVFLQNFTICTFPSLCWQLPINLCAAQKKECAEPYHDDQAVLLKKYPSKAF